MTYCTKCGAECSDKFQIELKINTFKPFCNDCFNKLLPKSIKEIKRILKDQ